MLSFDIRTLGARAATVDDYLSAEDLIWQPEDPRPTGPVHVTGRLSPAGPGRYYWHGRFSGRASQPCRRCLEEAQVSVAGEVHLIFVEANDEEADNPDVYILDRRAPSLDLRPAIRENWLLEVPGYVLCREDCQGLCATCGAELNRGPCGCPPVLSTSARWEALPQRRSKNG